MRIPLQLLVRVSWATICSYIVEITPLILLMKLEKDMSLLVAVFSLKHLLKTQL